MSPGQRGTVCITANTTWYVYNFRSGLIDSLLRDAWAVIVLSPADRYVDRITRMGARHVHLSLDNAGVNPVREFVCIGRMARVLKRERPTVVLTYTPKINIYASLAGAVLRIPVIANVSGLGRSFGAGGWMRAISKALYKIALRHPRVVFFQNEEDRVHFVTAGLVGESKAGRLPGSGVDINKFTPRFKQRQSHEIVFLLAARLLWEKGVGEFVQAAAIVRRVNPGARFRLVGFVDSTNPGAVPLDQLVRWQGENLVEYLGATDDVAAAYGECDCVVLPSYYREGVPRSLLEAASMGIPVITTNTPGCRDTVDHEVTGYLCQPRDANDLAAWMLRFMEKTPDERVRMGQAARAKMLREFDESIVIARYMASIAGLSPTVEAAKA